jgi:hypothetical protein
MRPSSTVAALALLLVLAACGGENASQSRTGIPADVAARLASQSDAIAASLEAGDECGAAHEADDLRSAAEQAVARGSVPAEFRDELEAAVSALQNDVNCPAPEQMDEDNGKGKKKGHRKHGSTTTSTTTGITVGTTTGESD